MNFYCLKRYFLLTEIKGNAIINRVRILLENVMKSKLFSVLQRIGRSFMLPIALLPIAGLFLGVGSCLTNETTIASLHLTQIVGNGTFLHDVFMIMMKVGSAIFNNLPLIFAASVALGMSKKEKEVAVLSAIIAFFVMHTTINGMLIANGSIIADKIAPTVMEGTITSVCGILSLEMGVFGGILVGLGVSYLHNRFYRIELPSILSFFEGTRFVPIVSALAFFLVGFLMYFIWPFFQEGIFALGQMIRDSGYGGTFVYGIIKRLLVPFGLHHVFYLPFWQTAIGGAMEVQGVMVYGGQNIFFAQLADPNTVKFSADATRYFSGELIFMIFGLPGAALAMYRCAKIEHKKVVGSLLLSAALTSMLTGITEPIEFAFLFAAPMLFGVQVILAGSAYMIAHMLQITIGLTFSGGLIDFIAFGVLQGNAKTNWMMVIPIGIVYFLLYYSCFTFLIKKFNLKTPGRDDELDTSLFHKKVEETINQPTMLTSQDHKQSNYIVQGLGGKRNISDYDSCITRIRATVMDASKVDEGLLKKSGAAAVMMQGDGVQIIYGPKASSIKSSLDEYLLHVEEEDEKEEITPSLQPVLLYNIVDGEVMPIDKACDPMFSHKLLGDGVMIIPKNGHVVAPCDGVITMLYPTKHAIGILMENGCEILLHFGIDSVRLQGKGFEVLVKMGQHIHQGQALWNADVSYIKEHATSETIMFIITNKKHPKLQAYYGAMKQGDLILKVHES